MSTEVRAEVARSLSLADEHAETGLVAGLDASSLVERFGSPLFVYDLEMIEARVRALTAALPHRFRLAYAVKSNPALAVVATMADLGIGADVASAGELELVRRAGFEPPRVMFTGPGKREEELAAAVESGIGVVTVESPGELRRLERIAAASGRRQPIMLRLAVAGDAALERVQLIGHAGGGKFGMSYADAIEATRHALASPYLEWVGLHAFGASNVLDADAIANHVAQLMAWTRDVAAETGARPRLVDAGGGLGIPYADGEAPLDLERLRERLGALRDAWNEDELLRDTDVLLEPGRFFVGPAGVFLATVVDVKGTDESLVAILDGGINDLVRPALTRTAQRIRVAGRGEATAAARCGGDSSDLLAHVTVAGPLCTGIDVFGTELRLPRVCPGDVVAVMDAGAYGYTESMPFFLSHPIPAEVAVRHGEARLIRPRISPAELLDRQLLPSW